MTVRITKKQRDAVADAIWKLADDISKKKVNLLTYERKDGVTKVPGPYGWESRPSGEYTIILNLRRRRSRSRRATVR
jgi:hypothetical protein